ncbi:MMPL family transporter [Streptomyces sp. AD55]|uniref:MMPL family transporter n=1 Tax=Streptomyces sp. AD55 TaxID=3242895 RepID=UPI003529A320
MYTSILRCFLATRKRASVVVLFWVLLAGLLAQLAPDLTSVQDNTTANLPPAASDSMRARDLVREEFPGQDALPAVIVVRGPDGDRERTAQAVERITSALAGPDRPRQVTGVVSAAGNPRAAEGLVSGDGGTQLLLVPVEGSPSDESFRTAVGKVRELARDQADGAEVAVTGPAGIATDTVAVFSQGDRILLLATVLLVLVLLFAIYRSPLLALIPLLAAGVAMRVSETLGALMADAGWFGISSQTASIMTVLLFGVGTDYALIITARYREALLDEPDRHRAMQTAMRGVGETVLASASTVVLAMFALLVAVSPSLRGFGPYLALGVAVMALVAFTFVPAVVLLLGRSVFWPGGVRKAAERSRGGSLWRYVADLVTRAPVKVTGAVLAVLVAMGAGLAGYQQSFDFVSGFRVDTESEHGRTLVRDAFGPGALAPVTVLVRGGDDLRATDAPAHIAGSLARVDGVADVGERPQLSRDGHTASFQVVLDQDPYSPGALDAVEPLRKSAQTAAERAGVTDAEALVGGETAQTADIRSALDRDTVWILALVLAVVTGVLALLLRSLLAPVYLVVTLVLSFVATMGATTFVTVTVLGDDGIGNRVTAYVFVFLVALGVDYNIFIMSRFKEEARVAQAAPALKAAVTRTGGVVSSAGLILAATFAVLMTQPIRELFQFGFAMAFGILLDTFVIRPLLVPSLVRLLGDRALWPTRMSHPGRSGGNPATAHAAPTAGGRA